ncbi:TetR/AcrR family transcriptional regulator [Nocardioides sp. NPDC006273]|uniref:TetR/AcrR family transcriptional regulator n=1 Tax=Nocardioides sp. NPDC006273 TaxID=3155598 RepID=UPI0033A04804
MAQKGRSYGGLTREERDAQRRQRLLAAAKEIIGTKGYAASTIPGMCAASKVSTRHFYELYPGKEDLFVDLYDRITADSYARVAASLGATAGEPIFERVPAAVLAYLDPMLKDTRVARIAFVEIMGASPRIEKLRLGYRETLVEIVSTECAAAVRRGEIRDRDWRFAALALVGAVTAIVYDWALRRPRSSREALENQLAGLALVLFTSDPVYLPASSGYRPDVQR